MLTNLPVGIDTVSVKRNGTWSYYTLDAVIGLKWNTLREFMNEFVPKNNSASWTVSDRIALELILPPDSLSDAEERELVEALISELYKLVREPKVAQINTSKE